MRWTLCECGTADLRRIPRAWWMRLFPARRRYQCGKCGHSLFVPWDTVLVNTDPGHRLEHRRHRFLRLASRWSVAVVVLGAIGWGASRELDGQPLLPFVGQERTFASVEAVHRPAQGCHRTHIYKAGETLEGIASSEMGADWHAQDIWVLNRALLDRLMLEDKGLEAGQPLEVPAPCPGG